jgi:hypothetical protein
MASRTSLTPLAIQFIRELFHLLLLGSQLYEIWWQEGAAGKIVVTIY